MALDDKQMLALLAPEYRVYVEWLRAQGWPPLDQHSVPDARARMRQMQTGNISSYAVSAERYAIDGFSVQIVKPSGVEEPLPAIVYYHGGGWALGDCDTHARMVHEIAVQSRAAVVFVEYARAPEARHPALLEQCYRALTWIAEQGSAAGLDAARIAVAGDSAGGGLAAAVSMLAAQRGRPRICLQALLYPVTDCDFTTASYRDFETGLNLDAAAMRWFWNHYLPDEALRADPLVSPLRATLDDLRGLPPALVITAECDVLRDEGEAFAHKLASAGVPVTAVRFGGVLHAFMMIDQLAHERQAASAMRLLASELRQAFGETR
ncbi:MAG: alpha/beta hydrolase [Terracidiphilus sp.]|jgi:acetyl esterase